MSEAKRPKLDVVTLRREDIRELLDRWQARIQLSGGSDTARAASSAISFCRDELTGLSGVASTRRRNLATREEKRR